MEALRWIALFRIALPSVILRYAGGREITLRELQVMGMTSGINALIVGNYLTTLGRSRRRGPADARRPADADRRAHRRALSPPVTRPAHSLPRLRRDRLRRLPARRWTRPATARSAAAGWR